MELRIMDALDLSELRVEPVAREMEPRFNELMDRHHYPFIPPQLTHIKT